MFRRERRPSSELTWSDDRTFRFDDAEYLCRPFGNRVPSTSDRFCILKPRWSVELYEKMLTELAPRNVVEVGIYDGGSTALFAGLAQPHKLVAIDVKTTASPALEEYLDARRLRDTVSTYYGVTKPTRCGSLRSSTASSAPSRSISSSTTRHTRSRRRARHSTASSPGCDRAPPTSSRTGPGRTVRSRPASKKLRSQSWCSS